MESDGIFHIFDQIKVLMLRLYIGHCHLCMEAHIKLRLQSLKAPRLDLLKRYK